MSYINDALRKAQKDKESPYADYEQIVTASGQNINKPHRGFRIAGILMLLFCAAGTMILLNRPSDKKMSPRESLNVSNAQTTVPMEPVEEKITVVNKKEPVSNIIKADENNKGKTENAELKKLYAQAFQKHQEGHIDEAKTLYKKVIKIDPRNVEALNNLAVIYMKKNVHKWAIIRLNDALKVKYAYPDAHYNLACIYAQQNDTKRSLSYLKNAVRFNPRVRQWAENDKDLMVLADLPEFKKLMEKK